MVRKLQCRRGFSFIELIVAMAVLVFGVYGVYHAFLETRPRSQARLFMAQGRMLAHQRFAELQATPYAALRSWSGDKKFKSIDGHEPFQIKAGARENNGVINIVVSVGWHPDEGEGRKFPEGQLITVKGVRAP